MTVKVNGKMVLEEDRVLTSMPVMVKVMLAFVRLCFEFVEADLTFDPDFSGSQPAAISVT